MAIVLDPAVAWPHGLGPRVGPSSHLCSDLLGDEGHAELMAFARRIGMRPQWLQKPGTEHEHFDVFGSRRPRAIAAGAREVTRREIVEVWRRKRAALRGQAASEQNP